MVDPGRHSGQRRAHRQRQPPEPGIHQVIAHQLRAPAAASQGERAARAQAREGQAAQDASHLFNRTSACDMVHVTGMTAPRRPVRMRLAPVSREHCLKTASNQTCCRTPIRALRHRYTRTLPPGLNDGRGHAHHAGAAGRQRHGVDEQRVKVGPLKVLLCSPRHQPQCPATQPDVDGTQRCTRAARM